MAAPWFHVESLAAGECLLDARESHHALDVLRLAPGDGVTLFDGRGRTAVARLIEPLVRSKRDRACRLTVERIVECPPPASPLALLIAAPKGPRLDVLVEKCTELGVAELVLVNFERSVVQTRAAHAGKLRDPVLAACKQCRRPWLMKIEAGMDLAAAWEHVCRRAPRARLIVADAVSATVGLAEALRRGGSIGEISAVVVGPEGGLTPHEIDWARAQGGVCASLGAHTLRIETAGLAAAAIWGVENADGPAAGGA